MNLFLLCLSIVVLLAANALFVAAEFAAVSVKRSRIAQLVERGGPLVQQLLAIIEKPRRLDLFVSTCQLGITISSLALGFYGQARVIEWLSPLLLQFAPGAVAYANSIATVVVLLLLTLLQVILAELLPKNVSLRYPERMALLTARPILWLQTLFYPLLLFLNLCGRLVLRLLGIQESSGHSHVHSPQEIVLLVEESAAQGTLDHSEEQLLVNTLELYKRTARKVMIPRNRILAASVDEPVEVLLAILAESSYSRLPLFEGTVDQIVGMVHIKDLLLACAALRQGKEANQPIITGRMLLHPVEETPDSLLIERVMERMQAHRRHLAIVVDEYGGTAGMVTFEDLIEEIIGEFRDEFDKTEALPWELRGRLLWVRGDLQLDTLNDLFALRLPVVDVDTVGGLISSRLGRLPNLRDQITLDDVTIRVESVVGNGVRMVSITLTPEQIAHLSGAALPAKTASAVEPTSGEATLKNAAIQ